MAGFPGGDWARNVRAAGQGELASGRRRHRVRVIEIADRTRRRTVLRAFPAEVAHGVPFSVRLGLVATGRADEFEAADRVAVFEIITITS